MGEINASYKRAIKETIHNLKVEAKKEKLDHKVLYELYLDLQMCVQYGFMYDTDNKEYYKRYSDYIKEIALKEVTTDKKRANTCDSFIGIL
jgi:hypothetical protein